MRKLRRSAVVFGLAAFLTHTDLTPQSAWAQDVTVQASVRDTTIGDEETLTFTVEVSGASFSDIETPEPPGTKGLVLQQEIPFTYRNVSVVKGAMHQSVAYEWNFHPVRSGRARLKAITVTVKGQGYRTEAIAVEVVPQAQRPERRNRADRILLDPFRSECTRPPVCRDLQRRRAMLP